MSDMYQVIELKSFLPKVFKKQALPKILYLVGTSLLRYYYLHFRIKN